MLKIKSIFKTHHGAEPSGGAAFMIGAGISAILLVAVSFIAAIIANATDDPVGKLGVYSLAALLVSAVVSGAITTRISKNGGVKTAALSSLMIALIMMLTGLVSNGGMLPRSGIMNYICYVITFIFSAYLLKRREGAGHGRRRKH